MDQELDLGLGVDSCLPKGSGDSMPPHHCFLLLPGFPGKCDRVDVVGSSAVTAPQAADPARMGPLCLLLTLRCSWPRWCLGRPPSTAGAWSTGTLITGAAAAACSALGHPPVPTTPEFSENCGLNDSGDHMSRPFKECPFGQCSPDSAELCSPCGSGATAPAPAGSRRGTQQRCPQRSIPPKEPCPLKSGKPDVLSSQDPSPSPISSLSWTSERSVTQVLPNFALPVVLVFMVLVLLVTSAVVLLVGQWCHRQAKVVLHPSSSPGSLEASETGDSRKEVALVPLLGRELPNLASQPLSRLLDELEVLEEPTVLLDPEPGPGGGMACGTTRHLAARYGVPAACCTFAYSLRPGRSPLRALIEMVVAREPSASPGQLGTHLAQLGRADALQVLSKLG
ncbi:IGF-like family receptor 1 isoform X1 [Lontra canadensis]|uniref:IGF-like family receptor 1 isoform X1 n=1 Tax=Lontra canadensis TaxID=76717 RepID=UPI0013F38D5F|nr:IGF-like family receptor 1 isoform X1 [Lontra canadensis]